MSEQRILAIVGGVGPESTADYYRRLVARWLHVEAALQWLLSELMTRYRVAAARSAGDARERADRLKPTNIPT